MALVFGNRDDWKKGVKIFLENSTVPYEETEVKWPTVIVNEDGDIFFEFNEYVDYVPSELSIYALAPEEQESVIKLFDVENLDELIETFNVREEAFIEHWDGIDKNNIEEEIENALSEALDSKFFVISEDEYNEGLEEMDDLLEE